MSLTNHYSEADCLSRIMLSHAPRQATVSLNGDVRQKKYKTMKSITSLLCILSLALSHPVSAADDQKSLTPVKLSISNSLVESFPIEITATTTDKEMRFTFGPKADGLYCVLDAQIDRLEDGSAKITATFSEETKVFLGDGTQSIRNVGFANLSTVLAPGEEEALFTSGEKKFVVKFIQINKK